MANQTTWNGYCSLRSLLRAYGQAKKSKVFDSGRLNRGLGIAMRAQTTRLADSDLNHLVPEYRTPGHEKAYQYFSRADCGCSDHHKSQKRYCKHRVAAMLLDRAAQLDKALVHATAATEKEVPSWTMAVSSQPLG